MSITLFDLYAAEVCPHELAAREAARAAYEALVARFLDGAPDVREADCLAAKDLADRADLQARDVFRALWSSDQGTQRTGPACRSDFDTLAPVRPGA